MGDVREIEVVGEDVAEVNFHFQVRYHFASRIGRLLWFTPLARIQSLFFKTPLVHAFIWGSSRLPRPLLVAGPRQEAHGRGREDALGEALRGLRVSPAGAPAQACDASAPGPARALGGRDGPRLSVALDRRATCRVEPIPAGVEVESKESLTKASGSRRRRELVERSPGSLAAQALALLGATPGCGS